MLRALACSLLFLTRIPLPRLTLEPSDFARSSGFFAWVGALIAALLWGASLLLVPALGARLAALVLISLWVAITGGLHLDGLADLTDGLSGGRGERARTLEIMRDSRIGAHGAVALALLLMLKWAALERALELQTLAWTLAPVLGRFAATLCIASFPYARERGLGSPFVGSARAPALALGVIPLVGLVVLLGPGALVPAALGLSCALLLALRVQRLLNGLTGDVYGAAIELAELGVLLSVTALR